MTRASQDFGQAQRHAGILNGFVPLKLLGLVLAGFLCFALDQAVSQELGISNTPRTIGSAEDIFTEWQPHQRLYVKGALGVGDSQLAGLEQWLDQNGTNWIVVLMETAAGERFTDASGASFRNMDAVEHRLGKGLPAQTEFGIWSDPRTGERNGAFFVLFLKERKFAYYGSDAQDNRALGESRWSGELDKPAIAAMRSGGRIIDAAKDTVTSINLQLDRKIAGEKRKAEQIVARAKAYTVELQSRAKGLIELANQNMDRLEKEVLEMRESDLELTGSIVHPDIVSWRVLLASANTSLGGGELKAAVSVAESVNEQLARATEQLQVYKNAAVQIEDLQSGLAELEKGPYADYALSFIESAESSLSECRQAYASADPSYVKSMVATRDFLSSAKQRILSEIKAEKLRKDLQIVSVSGGGFALLLLGIGLNRRRRPIRSEAIELIHSWRRALDEKRLAASSLLHRSIESLGVTKAEADDRFDGQTLVLVEQTIRDVDELVIMSNCAGRVLENAAALVHPEGVSSRTANVFFKGRYLAAVRKLRDEPITFQPEEGIARVLQTKRTERDRLLGDLETYQPFKLSFNELIENFNQRAERSLNALNEIDKSQLRISDLLIEVQQRIDETRTTAVDLEKTLEPDALFSVSETLMTLLPSANEDYSTAATMSISDPIGALKTVGTRAVEQSDEAKELVGLAADYHGRIDGELGLGRQELTGFTLATEWIDEALEELSVAFNDATRESAKASSANSINEINQRLGALLLRTGQIAAAERTRVEQVLPAIVDTDRLVATTRVDLATKLNIDSKSTLIEEGRNPDHFQEAAREQASAARTALNRGDVEAAGSANSQALVEIAVSNQLVQRTLAAFEEYRETLGTRTAEVQRLVTAIPSAQLILESIESGYAPSVLLLGAGDSTHPEANGTIRDNLKECDQLMATVADHLRHATDRHVRGGILDSADALARTEACQQLVELRIQEIRDKQDRLTKTENANHSLFELLKNRIDHLESLVADARTMRETLELFSRVQQHAETCGTIIDAPRGDPFKLEIELDELRGELDRLDSALASDWDLHAETARSIDAAQQELSKLGKLETRSATDRFPDSLQTREIIRQAAELKDSFGELRRSLSDAHGDWNSLDEQVDDLARQAGFLSARLRDDLAAAEKAYAEFQAATKQVRSAGRWSGGYGVAISSQHGMDLLTRARQGLQRGDYAAVLQAAITAKRRAKQAVAEAEAEVHRRRRAEEARIEQERQQRRAAARRAARAASRSSFSSGSGSSRSSFSSGSGTSRSGW